MIGKVTQYDNVMVKVPLKQKKMDTAWGGGGGSVSVNGSGCANGSDVHGREMRDKTLSTSSWEGG